MIVVKKEPTTALTYYTAAQDFSLALKAAPVSAEAAAALLSSAARTLKGLGQEYYDVNFNGQYIAGDLKDNPEMLAFALKHGGVPRLDIPMFDRGPTLGALATERGEIAIFRAAVAAHAAPSSRVPPLQFA